MLPLLFTEGFHEFVKIILNPSMLTSLNKISDKFVH